MSLKKLKADNMDKDGLREAEIRKRFNSIMYTYGLAKLSDIKLDETKVKVISRKIFAYLKERRRKLRI